ncbi:hypothetical protein KR032_000130, partial [Drosophila birchii]
IMLQQRKLRRENLAGATYAVTIVMLIFGQMQAIAFVEIKFLNAILGARYGLNLVQFFISFMTIQLYGFFYRIIACKPTWVRLLAGAWTYEINTISIMKPTKRAPYFCHVVSAVATFLMIALSAGYGHIAMKHKRGLFITRSNVILWSERLYVLTCFGIIITVELQRSLVKLPIMVTYMVLSNVYVIIFGASIRRPYFYHYGAPGDYILIGQLYYLNFFALYMSYLWTLELFLQLTGW